MANKNGRVNGVARARGVQPLSARPVIAPVPEPEPQAEPPAVTTGAEADEQEKDYYAEPMAYVVGGGATDFDALDKYRAAQEVVSEVQSLSYDFQSLLSNIMADPMTEDKTAAIAALARQFEQRVTQSGEKEAPAAEPQAPVGLFDRAREWARRAFGKSEKAGPALAGSFVVHKSADGTGYWIGAVSNKWRDSDTRRHKDGEIITDAAHKEFIAYLDAHPDQAPELWSWHTPGTARKHRADWWDYADGFLVMSGRLTPEEVKQFDDGEELGMSHGFRAMARDDERGLIEKYRTFEVSELPPEWVANPWTPFEAIKKEWEGNDMPFTDERRAHLVKRFGEPKVKEWEGNLTGLGKALDAMGVESKDQPPAAGAPAPAAEPAAKAAPAADDQVPAELAQGLDVISAHILKAINVDGLKAGLTAINQRLDKIEAAQAEGAKSDDERVAELLTPKVKGVFDWGLRPTESEKNLVTDDDEAGGGDKPKVGWLKEIGAIG